MHGEIDVKKLEGAGFDWFSTGIAAYRPATEAALQKVREIMARPGMEAWAFLGTWCGDTHTHLPAFIKTLTLAGVPHSKIRLFALDREKKLPTASKPAELLEPMRIKKVPIFVFLKDGKEIGRIIESPTGDMATQIAEILEDALQEKYSPVSACFGCGPANEKGLRIRSHVSHTDPTEIVADWRAELHHEAFPGMLNGGIVGALLDCHSNWTAAYHLMTKAGQDQPPCTVTADYAIQLKRPTPTDGVIHLSARVVDSKEDRATIEATLTAGGKVWRLAGALLLPSSRGHPAYHRW